MKSKENLDKGTIQKLQSFLADLKAVNGVPLLQIAAVLQSAGISFDKAISAKKKNEPQDFFLLFNKYLTRPTIEWYPVCRGIEIDLLASVLSHKAKQLAHSKAKHNPAYYPFFIAGLERLINYHKSLSVNFPSTIVIFTSLFTSFKLSPVLQELEYNMAGIPYCPPRTPTDREALERIKKFCYEQIYRAIDEVYSIILLNNTPLTLEVLEELRNKPDKPNASDWLILSFFHDLDVLVDNKVPVTDTEFLDPLIILRENRKEYDSFENYPFVQKVNIPHGFQITAEYLQTLFAGIPR